VPSPSKTYLREAAPEGLYTNLMISERSTLVDDVRIKGVSLTGSEGAELAWQPQQEKFKKRSVLELGGSDSFMCLEDADINKAIEMAIGRMNNNGQSCVASKDL
jgi:succinate-semialdehyde dehydrogenase/glutarate-semialdehyde dehydrogenase